MERADAIVVLGCLVLPGGEPSASLARRIALGARAHEEGVAPVVLACGGRRWHGVAEAVVMKRGLLAAGLPEDHIALELRSLSTAENAYFGAAWLHAQGARRAMLATCRWHLPRALDDFRRCGLDAIAPPSAWLEGPPASLALRGRERVSRWLDAALLRARMHGRPAGTPGAPEVRT